MIVTDVILGVGKTIITDIANEDEGWAGIAISLYEAKTGEWVNFGAETDSDLGSRVRITSKNPESFDVVIAALERAKASLPQPPDQVEE